MPAPSARELAFAAREQRILAMAGEQLQQEGLLNLQMTRVARACDMAVGTLYQHFACKEDLLLALATRCAQLHVDLFRRAVQWQAGSRDRMNAIVVADAILACRHPEQFSLQQYALCEVVWQAASSVRRAAFLAANEPIADIVRGIAEDALAAGDLVAPGLAPQEVTTACWSLCVGMQNLTHVEGMLQHFHIGSGHDRLARYMAHLLNGLGWQPLQDPADEAGLRALFDRIQREVFHDFIA